MDIGFHSAGFQTLVAVEIDHSCCETLRLNMPNVPVIEGDISKITTEEILKTAGVKPLEIDVVIGGPPCQSFSLAGKRMGMDDPRGLLVLEYIRVVREALPKVFVMENVKGMMNWSKGRAMNAILSEISEPILHDGIEYSYDLCFQVLNSAHFGAPQFRERIFIVGNRINQAFEFPKATHGIVESCEMTKPEQMALFKDETKSDLLPYVTVGSVLDPLPAANPPSDKALRVSKTIKDRIKKHGY
jgi:DNA (cytosine-5)-methyltransferase 1